MVQTKEHIRESRNAWMKLAKANEKLLARYRTGSSKGVDVLIDLISSAKKTLKELEEL
jgi:hypothetical protein